ncbi:hypothetical protein Q0L23_04705 [Klebsiella michiganensis]|uniref:hypothetical protein n=1 Tax=Klebsiella michiganensis TaxID=1134687 RepID=UPI001C8BC09F|nr:hypothetical protein [Klebsiella michiganensis]WKJ99286.1 hypothetical protein Q0L46_06685 [Klebsiella michiganensis]WKK04757.1 hypothetical protein Q0L23_04705 [Klebsiella michiganensis]HCQ8416669.1 hypothetical protein [Klebsiella michiganensis]HDX8998542.1 hypothetical protein [Klebsiella michiganensis]
MAIPIQPVGMEMQKRRGNPYFTMGFLRFMKFIPDPGIAPLQFAQTLCAVMLKTRQAAL